MASPLEREAGMAMEQQPSRPLVRMGVVPEAWEYSYVNVRTSQLAELARLLNDLGADGWELVTTHSTDQTVGLNSVTALIRRKVLMLAPPPGVDPGWYPDPSGRFEHRQWNGHAWTFHVASNGETHRDPPTRLDPTPGLTQ
jgi:hypothetical protein